jgi:2-oxoisovalerate dehydrogenase E1 component alpha subunit
MQTIRKLWGASSKSLKLTSLISRNIVKFNEPYKDEAEIYTPSMTFRKENDRFKTFRVMDLTGKVISPEFDNVPKETLLKIFDIMIKLEEMDTILYMAQRQGKISFYMTSFGEGAATIATTAALSDEDLIYPQYREQGSIMWRGFQFEDFINQCMGNIKDLGKGRQMPVHYGSSKLNWVTVSSPLTTQVPQASGAGYGFKLQGADRIAVTFFGEGAASEGDFHAALNFAATLKSHTLFLCRNNKYAISTPISDQYAGDHIAGRAVGYGMPTIRVDGNDALAVYQAVKAARKMIVEQGTPVFIEFMTYRVGDHSTSDHSVLYRGEEEFKSWQAENNPISRLGLYLKEKNWREFNKEKDDAIRKGHKDLIIKTLRESAALPTSPWEELFDDVYDKLTPNLVEQKNELREHLEKHAAVYEKKSH